MIHPFLHKLDEYSYGLSRAAHRIAQAAGVIAMVLFTCSIVMAFTAEQVDRGREVFRLQCARCHGPDGQGITNIYRGMTAPPLIAPSAFPLNPRPYQKMRHFQFRTVRDIYEFASAVMPADQPASLSEDDYWDAIAYLLNANGVAVNGQLLNEDAAADMSLAQLQARAKQLSGNEMPLPAPAGNAPVIEGVGGNQR
jgi:polar amino acid transport system substrate-binding protein